LVMFPPLHSSALSQGGKLGSIALFKQASMSPSQLEIRPGHNLGEASPLFSKVESEDIEKYKKQLGPSESQ